MMNNGEVAIGHHCTALIPITLSNDVYGADIKCIRCTYDRSNVEIVLPILNRNLQLVSLGIEISNNRGDRPIAIVVEDIASVAIG